MDRRDFLKTSGVTAATAALPTILPSRTRRAAPPSERTASRSSAIRSWFSMVWRTTRTLPKGTQLPSPPTSSQLDGSTLQLANMLRRLPHSVLRAGRAPSFDSGNVKGAAHNMVFDSGQVLDPTAADQHH